MRTRTMIAAAIFSLAAPWHAALSAVTVEIIATDPEDRSELNARDPLYVRIAYKSDIPVRFQLDAYLDGMQLHDSAYMNPAPAYPAGEGEAIAWIAYRKPTQIDEIYVQTSDKNWNELMSTGRLVDVSWTGLQVGERTPASWAARLSGAQQQMVGTAFASESSELGPAFTAVFMFAGLSIPGYWILQVYVWRRYRDRWRKWAVLPLWITVPLVVYTVLALLAGSNLWPLMLIFVSPFAFAYLIAVIAARKYVSNRHSVEG